MLGPEFHTAEHWCERAEVTYVEACWLKSIGSGIAQAKGPVSRALDRMCWIRDHALSVPRVPEGGIGFNFLERRIETQEFLADTLNGGAHVDAIAVFARSRDETLVAQPVVDGAIALLLTPVCHQQVDNLVFAKRQSYVRAIPIGAIDRSFQDELAID